MQGEHLRAWAIGQAWAVEPGYLQRVAQVVQARARQEPMPGLTPDERRLAAARDDRSEGRRLHRSGAIAIVPVFGMIVHRAGMVTDYSGGTSVQSLQRAVREAVADDDVRTIVLDFDSPGGSVAGIVEFADELRRARERKALIAVANTQAASAAYWLAAQATTLAVTPSGTVGSVGVYSLHEDVSGALEQAGIRMTYVHAGAHKVEGNNYEPLAPEARRELQAHVDGCYQQFVTSVAQGRRVSEAHVRKAFGQGRLVRPADALAAGMVDRIATLEDIVREAQGAVAPSARPASRARTTTPPPQAMTPTRSPAHIEIQRRRLRLSRF
jgi:signal peptide peptidase SppA